MMVSTRASWVAKVLLVAAMTKVSWAHESCADSCEFRDALEAFNILPATCYTAVPILAKWFYNALNVYSVALSEYTVIPRFAKVFYPRGLGSRLSMVMSDYRFTVDPIHGTLSNWLNNKLFVQDCVKAPGNVSAGICYASPQKSWQVFPCPMISSENQIVWANESIQAALIVRCINGMRSDWMVLKNGTADLDDNTTGIIRRTVETIFPSYDV